MSRTAVAPPLPTTADRYQTDVYFYVGGPLNYVRDASLMAGIAAETAAESTVATTWNPDTRDTLVLTDASDFTSRGAVRLTLADGTDYWWTFESRSGNTLHSLNPVFDQKSPYTARGPLGLFPVGTVASQWYDISGLVDDWDVEEHEGDAESYFTMQLRGTGWNSLQIAQDAAILAVAYHWDSILGAHDPHILFSGWLGQPSTTGDPQKNTWEVGAEGLRKYLQLQRNDPQQYGGQLVQGTWTASEALGDLAAEPMEGQQPSDFAVGNVEDDDAGSLYISKDTPSVTLRENSPSGVVGLNVGAKPYAYEPQTGFGLRFDMAYLNPVPSGSHSTQDQKWIVVYNNHPIEPPDGPSPVSVLEWGKIDLTGYTLMTQNVNENYPLILYLSKKNGGASPKIILGPQQGAVLCYDEPAFRSQFSVPPGWQVFELKQTGGLLFGKDPNDPAADRGMGMAWDPNPNGCWFGLRGGGQPGNFTDSMYSGLVAAQDIDAGTVTLYENGWTAGELEARLATFPTQGYIRGESTDIWKCYTGVDVGAHKLTGVVKVKGYKDPFIRGGDDTERIDVSEFSGYWWDFLSVGEAIIPKIPRQFAVRRVVEGGDYTPRDGDGVQTGPSTEVGDGTMQDQNDSGKVGEKVWGVWNNGGARPVIWDTTGSGDTINFFRPGSAGWNAAPADWKCAPACPQLQAVRRSGTVGGGNFQQKASSPSWKWHDSNSHADWEVQTGPRLGNIAVLDSYIWLEFEAAELERAEVVADNTDVGDETGILTVKTNQAREYPTTCARTLPYPFYMRALIDGGGNVDFLYASRFSDETSDRFEGVTKLPGYELATIPAGATLVTMVLMRASWDKTGAVSYVQRNMPRWTGLSWQRWQGQPPEALVTDVTETEITVTQGAAAGFPTTGTLWFTEPATAGLIITTVTIGPAGTGKAWTADYTGRTDTTFTGVTWAEGHALPGWTASAVRDQQTSFPSDLDVLVTRQRNPASPITFLDRNQSWDTAYVLSHHSEETLGGHPGVVEKYFPGDGALGSFRFLWKLFVKVHRMAGGGRVKANRLRVHKMPYRARGAPGDSVEGWEWAGEYRTSTLAHDMLVDAGVDARRMSFSDGAAIFQFALADGNVWDGPRGLARMSSCILQETADNQLVFRPHPQAPGANHSMTGKLTLDGDALWGPTRATERPRHAVSQMTAECRDGVTDVVWDIAEPSDALILGTVRALPAQIVPNEQAGHAIVRLALRQANSGWELEALGGPPFVILGYGDVVRVVNLQDDAGRFFSGEFFVYGVKHSGGRGRMRSVAKLREWTVP